MKRTTPVPQAPQKLQGVKLWRKDIWAWVRDMEICIPSNQGGFEVFRPEPFQVKAVNKALARRNNEFLYRTICLCWPRRHSKTVCNALICLWRFFNWQTQNIKILANSERQTMSTAFKLCKQIVENTPKLRDTLGKENILHNKLKYPALQSEIAAVSTNESAAYGEKVSLAWVTELHAASDDSVLQVLASSLGDTVNSLLLVDSTTDGVGGPLHRLESLSEGGEDPTVYFSRIEYADLSEALDKSPSWISRPWLVSRSKQMLPALFESQHLNRRASAVNSLFRVEDIDRCPTPFPNTVSPVSLAELIGGRRYVAGGGLDRAYGFTLNGDATIWTVVAKVAGEDGEAEYYVLNQQSIAFSQGKGIKKAIAKDHERYTLENVCIEKFNAQDIWSWTTEAKIAAELVHATPTEQVAAFTELHRIVAEGRLRYPEELEGLSAELRTFQYDSRGKTVSFGHAKGFHDDRVYSLAWAIWALRDQELVAYELPSLRCLNKSPSASFCYLRSGDLILHCNEQCEAHKRVESMYLQYRRRNVDRESGIVDFFLDKVRVTGAKIYQVV